MYDEQSSTLVLIADVRIFEDAEGRFNLNALHHASGSDEAKKPGHWLKRKSARALIHELEGQVSFSTLDVVIGGDRAGTYAHELLAISYAGWISPAFQLKVNQAFLDMKRGSRLLEVHDHRTKVAIDTLMRLDEAEYRLAQVERESSVAKALAQQALDTQQWLTIREYCFHHALTRQIPPSWQREYGTYLTGYCQERGIPVRKQSVADRSYEAEHAYHVGTIALTLAPWLLRRQGQAPLALLPSRMR